MEKGCSRAVPRWPPTLPLKRAAVKFGVGRYLYRLPSQWVDYDPQKRQFVRTPKLPPAALPRRPLPVPVQPRAAAPKPPANGAELRERLQKYEDRLVKQNLCQPGELVNFIVQAGVQAGYDADLSAWEGPAIQLAVEQTKTFKVRMRRQAGAQKGAA